MVCVPTIAALGPYLMTIGADKVVPITPGQPAAAIETTEVAVMPGVLQVSQVDQEIAWALGLELARRYAESTLREERAPNALVQGNTFG